jgi:hypothetical protein
MPAGEGTLLQYTLRNAGQDTIHALIFLKLPITRPLTAPMGVIITIIYAGTHLIEPFDGYAVTDILFDSSENPEMPKKTTFFSLVKLGVV